MVLTQRFGKLLALGAALGLCPGIIAAGRAQSPFTFFRVQTQVDPASFGDASWIDIDADGDQDLLLVASTGAGSRVPTTAVFEQLSTTFTMTDEGVPRPTGDYRRATVLDAVDVWLSEIDWADYDRDGDLDAVVLGTPQAGAPFTPSLQIYENRGVDGLAARPADGIAPVLGVARWADVDNDGDADLLVAGQTAGGEASTRVYLNERDTFQPVDAGLPDVAFGDAAWADVDRDGDLDIALCGSRADGTYITGVFLNRGDATFVEMDVEAEGLVFCSLDWGDFDQDGFADLLVSGGRPGALVLEGRTMLYRNADGLSLVEQPFELEGVVGGSALWIDVDNDGALDVITNGGRDLVLGKAVTRIYRNEENQFRLVSNLSGTFPGRLDRGDFDGDGDVDLITVGLDRAGMAIASVFMNGELLVNGAPSEPEGLQADISGDRANLAWSPAVDDRTEPTGLTYNLRIGTEPGAGDVLPMPTASDGHPTRSSVGNVGSNISWRVQGLPNGTYYWSVQAVDNSFLTSDFSAEASFQVTESSGTKPVGDESVAGVPGAPRLGMPYPNPMRQEARVEYELPRSGVVRIDVFDVIGRRLNTIVDRSVIAGRHAEVWDGRDASGHELASGVYVIRLSAGGQVRSATVALLR